MATVLTRLKRSFVRAPKAYDPIEPAIVIGERVSLHLKARQSFWRAFGDQGRYEMEGTRLLVIISIFGAVGLGLPGIVITWGYYRDTMMALGSLIFWMPLGGIITYLWWRKRVLRPRWFFSYNAETLSPVICRDLLQDYLPVPADRRGSASKVLERPMVNRASHLYEIVKQRDIRQKWHLGMTGLQKIQMGILVVLVVVMAILLFFVIAQTSGEKAKEAGAQAQASEQKAGG